MRPDSSELSAGVHVPSSDRPSVSFAGAERPAPKTGAKAVVGVLVLALVGTLLGSVRSSPEEPAAVVQPPFEASPTDQRSDRPAVAWSTQVFPGDGVILALGSAAGTPVAVSTDGELPLIWQFAGGVWRLAGSPDIGRVEAAEVTDDRTLLVGRLSGRPTVWEWIDGESRYLFQSSSGFISGTWSVAGRLVVVVSETEVPVDRGIRRGRSDSLWIESVAGEFEPIDLVDLAAVFSVAGDADTIVVGGRDSDFRATVGSVGEGRVRSIRLPATGARSVVTDIEVEGASVFALVSNSHGPRPASGEIWGADGGWSLLAETVGLADIEVIGDVVHGAGVDGEVVSSRVGGGAAPAPSVPDWPGWIVGVAELDGEPVMFGSSEGRPAYAGPSAGGSRFALPEGAWERYHSEGSEGYRLVHVGSLDFAVRDGRLFHRAWNGERWQPALGDLAVYGTPAIIEIAHGFVLVPAARGGVWASVDGEVWDRLGDSEQVRIEQVASDGDVVVGLTSIGALGGPATEITVVDGRGAITRVSSPVHLVGLGWEKGVGFFATVAPPGSGHATSRDGLDWTVSDVPSAGVPHDRVVGLEGALRLRSGDSVLGGPETGYPTADGALHTYGGGVPVWSTESGRTWIHDGSRWREVGMGVADGLPRRPERLVLVGSRLFAMTEGVDRGAETYVIDLE